MQPQVSLSQQAASCSSGCSNATTFALIHQPSPAFISSRAVLRRTHANDPPGTTDQERALSRAPAASTTRSKHRGAERQLRAWFVQWGGDLSVIVTFVAIADVNWMLSAEMQSGAALVAIVAGLLGSRYVALHAEQQAAARRLADVENRLGPARERARRAADELVAFRVRDILDTPECYRALAEGGEARAPLNDVLTRIDEDEGGVPREALEQHLDFLFAELADAVGALKDRVPETEDQLKWEVFRRRHSLAPGHDGIWEWVYDEISEDRSEAARQRRRESRKGTLAGIAGFYTPPPISLPRVGALGNQGWRTATINRLILARDNSELEVLQLEAEHRAADKHLSDAAQPEGFGLALSVLAVVATVGIALPLVLMVSGPTGLPIWVRIASAAAFLAGVTLLLRYLFVYAAFLRASESRAELPTNLLGLLRRKRPMRHVVPPRILSGSRGSIIRGRAPRLNGYAQRALEGARQGREQLRGAGFVADARANGSDAFRVEVEHRDGGPARVVLMPYQRKGLVKKTVAFGQMSVSAGDRDVWLPPVIRVAGRRRSSLVRRRRRAGRNGTYPRTMRDCQDSQSTSS